MRVVLFDQKFDRSWRVEIVGCGVLLCCWRGKLIAIRLLRLLAPWLMRCPDPGRLDYLGFLGRFRSWLFSWFDDLGFFLLLSELLFC